jgi:membrane-associated phospholipid phosphatase
LDVEMREWRGNLRLTALLIVLLAGVRQCIAQTAPAPDPPDTTATAPTSAAHSDRPISWKLLVPNVVHDQKPIWLFPKAVAEGKHITPTIAVVSITGGLIALDPIDAPYFRRTQSFAAFNRDFSGLNTTVAMAAFPTAFYIYGLARKDSYAQHTVLLAGEAVLDSEILTTVMKDMDRRMLPGQVPSNSDYSDSWFRGHGQLLRGTGSFPSGHTIAAFSIATIFADRYPKPRWHRWVAFGLAGLVGFSRVPLQAHYPSDVFAGAVLGYTIAHYVVLKPQ